MEKVLTYASLLEFLKREWEANKKHPSIEIHRNAFISEFGDISFVIINRFLGELDSRYHAIKVNEYAYSQKWDDEIYMDMSAENIARAKSTEPFGKNLDAINRTTLTTSLVIEPDFLNVLESFSEPWELKSSKHEPVESLTTAKLTLKGTSLFLHFEDKQVLIWKFDSKLRKGYQVCRSLLNAKNEMILKDGLTNSILRTNTTQIPKLIHLEPQLAKLFYRHTKTHAALAPRIELSKHDSAIVRSYVNRKMRENRENYPIKNPT